MTQKADFNAEEWSLILEAGPTAAMIVIRSNKGGTIRESDPGSEVFFAIRDGNGTFGVEDAAGNQGTGWFTSATVTDSTPAASRRSTVQARSGRPAIDPNCLERVPPKRRPRSRRRRARSRFTHMCRRSRQKSRTARKITWGRAPVGDPAVRG